MLGKELSSLYKANPGFGLLSKSEVEYAVNEVKARHAALLPLQFVEVSFKEPTKEELGDAKREDGGEYYEVPRKAEVVSFHLESNKTITDIVNLSYQSIQSSSQIDDPNNPNNPSDPKTSTFRTDVQPPISPSEYAFSEELVKNYEPLNEALKVCMYII